MRAAPDNVALHIVRYGAGRFYTGAQMLRVIKYNSFSFSKYKYIINHPQAGLRRFQTFATVSIISYRACGFHLSIIFDGIHVSEAGESVTE